MPTVNDLNNQISFIRNSQNTEMRFAFENPFKLAVSEPLFISMRVKQLYAKILKDCFIRTADIKEEFKPLFWDSVVKSAGKSTAGDGLISLIAGAMAAQADLFLIFNKGILRIADYKEQEAIKASFKSGAKNKAGFWISFASYEMSQLLRLLFQLQFAVIQNANTGLNTSKALQLKISKMREMVSNSESAIIIQQAKEVVERLKAGDSVLLDLNDKVETTAIETNPVKTSIDLIVGMIADIINAPLYYLSGEIRAGLNATGEADSLAVEKCIESFFNSVFKPIVDDLFNLNIRFISENWRILTSTGDLLQKIDTISEDLIPIAVKQRISQSILKDFYTDEDKTIHNP